MKKIPKNQVHFKKVGLSDIKAFELLAKWGNQPDIKHLINVNFEEDPLKLYTGEQAMKAAAKNMTKESYLIYHNELAIGEVSLDIDPPHLADDSVKSGWLGILIGNPDYRGTGIGSVALDFIEKRARELGALRMELGVFAYNTKAKTFYEHKGYKQFHTFEKFTYYNKKWHDDYRMEKWF
ncbi:MAG: GNAT family protein [Vallitaleaceae bacterium]|nr:GNAT family protein [Vallitaleaceae bacterium]